MGRKVMERVYRARNGTTEITRFWVSDQARPRTGKKAASTPRKQEANRNQAIHVLGRLLNNNFEQGDLFLSPGYDAKAFRELRRRAYAGLKKSAKREEKRDAILAEAEKDGRNFIRRLREAGAKGLRYVLVPSDVNPDTGEEVQVHLHLVISGDQFQLVNKALTLQGRTLVELWGRAQSVEYEFLRGGSYNKLAAYLIRNTRDIKNRKRYTTSRNLERIVPEEYETTESPAEDFRIPAGASVEEWQRDPAVNRAMQYVRFMPREAQGYGKQEKPTKPRTKARKARGGQQHE